MMPRVLSKYGLIFQYTQVHTNIAVLRVGHSVTSTLKGLFVFIVVSALALMCLWSSVAATMAQDQAITLPNNSVYIDVRTWVEHKVDHIDGDERIHVSNIVQGVSEKFPDKRTPIRLYCARGVRSSRALDRLIAEGYLDVQNLGGIDDARQLRGLLAEPSDTVQDPVQE